MSEVRANPDHQGRPAMMTLRQVEVVRAVMVTGTIAGAAKLLNVSAPGISRLVKYTEKSLGLRFFQRQNGRYVPTPEAQNIFEQINAVYKKVDDLSGMISAMGKGGLSELRIGSVPSIAQVMVPRAIERVRRRYPDLHMDINILKIEEAIDYLLLGKGECVAMSYRLAHPALDFLPLASGELFCIVPEAHELAGRASVSAAEMIRHPLIGIDPNDPYGRIMAEMFARNRLSYDITIRARFGTTVCALVRAGLGIAVIDQFTVAHGGVSGIKLLRIEEPTRFDTYVAVKRGVPLSQHAESFIALLRDEMRALQPAPERAPRPARARGRK
jgi:DNA-binding transcriptional LysR family regulator